VGYARRVQTAQRAVEIGAIDVVAQDLAAAADADVVILATPVLAVRPLMAQLAPHLARGTMVTDVASTKLVVEHWAAQLLPDGVHFVGGHPMAGKETAGIDHADGALFQGRTWCIVPPDGAERRAVEAVTNLAAATGARTLRIGAVDHDRAVAAVSHLPFMASIAVAQSVIARDTFGAMAPMAATGLRDMTRLASGDPLMHRDICATNRDNLAGELTAYAARVEALAALVRRLPDPAMASPGDPALAELGRLFADLKDARDTWLRHDGRA